jgi:hypothetical protein
MTPPTGIAARATATPTIAPRCPNRTCRARLPRMATQAGPCQVSCPRCGDYINLNTDAELAAHGRLESCPVCGGREFFIRKDFPQRLGLLMVVVFGLAASVMYYHQRIVATFATLAALVLIDAVIYLQVGRVTVCYRCRAECRGVAYNPGHGGFDLATSEKYDA